MPSDNSMRVESTVDEIRRVEHRLHDCCKRLRDIRSRVEEIPTGRLTNLSSSQMSAIAQVILGWMEDDRAVVSAEVLSYRMRKRGVSGLAETPQSWYADEIQKFYTKKEEETDG